MKKNTHDHLITSGWLHTLLLCLFLAGPVLAQAPRGVPQPHENEPIDFTSLPELIVFIFIPVAAILLFLYLRRRRNKRL